MNDEPKLWAVTFEAWFTASVEAKDETEAREKATALAHRDSRAFASASGIGDTDVVILTNTILSMEEEV